MGLLQERSNKVRSTGQIILAVAFSNQLKGYEVNIGNTREKVSAVVKRKGHGKRFCCMVRNKKVRS